MLAFLDSARRGMANISRGVILGLVRVYDAQGGLEKVAADMRTVAQELVDGVSLTSISFEGGGGSGQSNRTPAEMLEMLEAVAEYYEGRNPAAAVTALRSSTATRT